MTAWGISPRKIAIVKLDDYSPDHYLTLLYYAIESLGWHISYFDHDGIIAYTNISWASYSEEISVRIAAGKATIKSECVGYQGLFNDYGKNQQNLNLLFGELDVRAVVYQGSIEQTAQQLMDSVPEKQFVQLDNPPMGAKEKLHSFAACFTLSKNYFITPILVYVNIAVYIVTVVALIVMQTRMLPSEGLNDIADLYNKAYMAVGFSGRPQVLHGQVWRLLTNTFLHFSLLHLVGNMIVLIYIGSMVESKLGRWNFLVLYLCTGIVSSMISVIWRDNSISGGASGAIFGLFGALLALLSTNFYERNARRALLISTGIFVAYEIIPIGRHIDHAAHFGGLISGYAFGLLAYTCLINPNRMVSRWATITLPVTIMIVFVTTGVAFTKDYQVNKYYDMVARATDATRNLNDLFYSNQDRKEKLLVLTQKALPQIKEYNDLADSLPKLTLPSKERKEVMFRSKIIKLQCRYYQLLYLEFKDHTPKYRPQIMAATDSINKLRIDWGTALGSN